MQPALDGSILVYVREPAVEGKANKAVLVLLADYYNVPKSNVEMVSGNKSRVKHFEITGF